jgi:type IV secretory pathway TrbF-like protein
MPIRFKFTRKKDKTPEQLEKDRIATSRREWDHRTAVYLNNLHSWQTVAILGFVGLGISLFYIGQYLQKPRLVGYVIYEQKDGSFQFEGQLQIQKLSINDAAVQNYLKRFITDTRSISSDKVVLKNSIKDCWDNIVADSCKPKLADLMKKSQPLEQSDKEIHVDVRFVVFEKIAERTWRAEWVEEVRERGILKDEIPMSGTFTYEQLTLSNMDKASENLFGLYFTDFYITERKS